MSRKHCGVRFGMKGRTCALARTCFITLKLYRTDAFFGLLAMKKRQNRSVILPCPGEIYVVLLQAFQGKCKEVDHWWSLYIISLANLHYIYIYVYIELVFFGVPILGLFRFTFCFLVTLNCPPPNPNARPQVISNAGSTAIYKLLARLCPCHESMSRKYAGLCPQVDHQAPAILLLPWAEGLYEEGVLNQIAIPMVPKNTCVLTDPTVLGGSSHLVRGLYSGYHRDE